MQQTFKKFIKELGRTAILKFSGKNFGGEIILGQYLQCAVLSEINFFNSNFEDVYFNVLKPFSSLNF